MSDLKEKEYELDGKTLQTKLIKKDIDEYTRDRAYNIAFEALKKYTVEKDMSEYIKNIFDNEFLPSWQCVVGI
jgi:hypothetical protein